MLTKDGLRAAFAKEWKQHYAVPLFEREGFERRGCAKCRKSFWTTDAERKVCGDSSCEPYGFLGRPVTKKKLGYVQMWKEFERFFVKNGHAAIERYPVVDRWRPDLYFTIASIQDFQRLDGGQMTFEFPADPLVVPQVCLRFNDIPNVGVTGRHHTSFIMGGQHSFGRYFKEQCLELNFGFLHGVLGIPKEKLTYIEDVWAMPDFSAFGPSVETVSLGLELVNHVFMQFTKNPAGGGYGNLPIKVNDTGWGHERLVWFSNGTQMGYDSVFPGVVRWLRKETEVKPDELFGRYAELAGGLDFEERNVKAIRARIAKELGVEVAALQRSVAPMQAIYAIADHLKTLLFAVTDGGIPSNVGGGYNLRVLLRRAFAFCEEHGWDLDLAKVAELHARELAPLFPELRAGLPTLADVIAVERERYQKTVGRGRGLVLKAIERGSVEKELETLFVSHGVTPELVEQLAAEQGAPVAVPGDFYTRIAEKHAAGEKGAEEEKVVAQVGGLPQTELAYYATPYEKRFESAVVAKRGEWLVLERTLFYPEGGGQPADRGSLTIGGKKAAVTDVQKVGGVVLHKVGPVAAKEGDKVSGEIDWDWRYRLMKAHTATHLMAGSARHVIGSHVWQAGAQKGYHASRLDLTHYRAFTPEEVRKIEAYANGIVRAGRKVETKFMPRGEAEQKYGFVLYQGGASPGKLVRVVKVNGVDVECCGGTHLADTKEIGAVKIVRSERLQDGVNRLEYAVAEAAEQWVEERKALAHRVALLLGKAVKAEPEGIDQAAALLGIAVDQLEGQVKKFAGDVAGLSDKLGQKPRELSGGLATATEALFAEWKELRKKVEHQVAGAAKERAEGLAAGAKDGLVRAVVEGGRKELIEICDKLVAAHPELTVIVANPQGEVVGMSKSRDVGALVRELCEKAGGRGGGSAAVAQGKGVAKRLRELLV